MNPTYSERQGQFLTYIHQTRPAWPIQSMTNAPKKPGGWSAVRQHLATWEKPALLALLKDLYEVEGEILPSQYYGTCSKK